MFCDIHRSRGSHDSSESSASPSMLPPIADVDCTSAQSMETTTIELVVNGVKRVITVPLVTSDEGTKQKSGNSAATIRLQGSVQSHSNLSSTGCVVNNNRHQLMTTSSANVNRFLPLNSSAGPLQPSNHSASNGASSSFGNVADVVRRPFSSSASTDNNGLSRIQIRNVVGTFRASAGNALRQMSSRSQVSFQLPVMQHNLQTGNGQPAVILSNTQTSYGSVYNHGMMPYTANSLISPAYSNVVPPSFGQAVPVAIQVPVCQPLIITTSFQSSSRVHVFSAPVATLSSGSVLGRGPAVRNPVSFSQFQVTRGTGLSQSCQIPIVRRIADTAVTSSGFYVGHFPYSAQTPAQNFQAPAAPVARNQLVKVPVCGLSATVTLPLSSSSGATALQQEAIVGQRFTNKTVDAFSQFKLIAPKPATTVYCSPVVISSQRSTKSVIASLLGNENVPSTASTVSSTAGRTSDAVVPSMASLPVANRTLASVPCISGQNSNSRPEVNAPSSLSGGSSCQGNPLEFSAAKTAVSRDSDEQDNRLNGPLISADSSTLEVATADINSNSNALNQPLSSDGNAVVAAETGRWHHSSEKMRKALQTARSIGKGMHHDEEMKNRRRSQRRYRRRKQRLTSLDLSDASSSSSDSWHPDEDELRLPSRLGNVAGNDSTCNWSSDASEESWGKSAKKRKLTKKLDQRNLRQNSKKTNKSMSNVKDEYCDVTDLPGKRIVTRQSKNRAVVSGGDKTLCLPTQSSTKSCSVVLEKLRLGPEHVVNVQNIASHLCCLQFQNVPPRLKRVIDSDCSDVDNAGSVSSNVTAVAAKTKSRPIVDSDNS